MSESAAAMTDPAAAGPMLTGPVARQAASVLRLAARVLGDVPPADARAAVSAVRCFATAPTSGNYLAAVRVLRHTERRHKLHALGRAVGHRRTEEGLDVLARGADLGLELVESLRALPADARNRRRLTLIAEMLTAYRLLEARASGSQRDLRRALGPLPRAATAERRAKRRSAVARRTCGRNCALSVAASSLHGSWSAGGSTLNTRVPPFFSRY